MQFIHSGKLGDIVFSIPAYRASRCTEYRLLSGGAREFLRYDPAVILPLLRANGVAASVLAERGVVLAEPSWVDGDRYQRLGGWRRGRQWRRWGNLAERHLAALGLPLAAAALPWLVAERRKIFRVIFARSPRYRPLFGRVDWAAAAAEFGDDAAFIGHDFEHAEFCRVVGRRVRRIAVRDYQEAAEVIAGAELCFVNQTGLQAVAVGLGVPHVLEVCESIDVCRFDGFRQEYDWPRKDRPAGG